MKIRVTRYTCESRTWRLDTPRGSTDRLRRWPTPRRPQTADDVIERRPRARRPLHPPLVHGRARPAEELLDQRLRARGRVRGRDGLRRLVDHRLQPDRGVGHDRRCPTRRPSPSFPGAPRRRRPRGCSATSRSPAASPTRAIRAGSCAGRSKRAEEHGLRRLQHRPRARVLLLQGRAARGRRARDPRRGRLLRPDHARRRLRRPPRDDPRARAARHPRRVRPPRGRALPARGRHALQGRARDVRRLHDVPDRGQGVRDEVRLARDLHAEAAVRRERLGHARTPVAVEGRQERLLRRRRPVLPLRRRRRRSSPASSGTRARSRRCSPSG